jgi:hypothetical protein
MQLEEGVFGAPVEADFRAGLEAGIDACGVRAMTVGGQIGLKEGVACLGDGFSRRHLDVAAQERIEKNVRISAGIVGAAGVVEIGSLFHHFFL